MYGIVNDDNSLLRSGGFGVFLPALSCILSLHTYLGMYRSTNEDLSSLEPLALAWLILAAVRVMIEVPACHPPTIPTVWWLETCLQVTNTPT